MFAYPCPSCQQRLQASPERVGQRTICPKCLKPIVIPCPDDAPVEEARVRVPSELIGDSPSTIFVDDVQHDDSGADAMDLSLPPDHDDEFLGYLNDSAPPGAMEAVPQPLAEPQPIATNNHVGSYSATPLAMAAAGVVTTATPHLGGVGAGPAAFTPPLDDTPMPSVAEPTPVPRDNGVVVFQSTPEQSADIAAELTTALTMRMKPPPEPPSDLRLSTGAWLALTAIGFSLWLLSMMRPADAAARELLNWVGAIGIVEIITSYVWVAYLSGRKTMQRGLEALLPPVWLYRLANPCENTPGYRPLRFFVAGLLIVGLALLGEKLRPAVQQITGEPDTRKVEIPKPLNSPLSRLKDSQSEGLIRPVTDALHELATDQAAFTASPAEAAQLLDEIKRLRKNPNGEIRGAALLAMKKWAGLDAVKPDVLAVLRNKNSEAHERRAALDVAREYKDREIARAVAACMGYRGFLDDSDRRAADALRAIGPPEAEEALLELFEDEDLLIRGLPGLLAELGGAKSVTRLRQIAASSPSKDVRDEAAKTADRIAVRLGIDRK